MSKNEKKAEWTAGFGKTQLVENLKELQAQARTALKEYSKEAKRTAKVLKNVTEKMPDAMKKQTEIHDKFRREHYDA